MTGSAISVGVGLLPALPVRELADAAAEAEARGFDHIWVPDERFFRDVMVTLTAVARRTRTALLGPCVTDPFVRHPAITATCLATLQEASHGRVVVGLGAGISGFEAMGTVAHRPAASIRATVRLLRTVFAGGQVAMDAPVHFHGGIDFGPVPVPPIYVAGRGPRILEVAGEVADGVMLGGLASPAAVARAMVPVEAGLRKAGRTLRDLRVAAWTHTVIGTDPRRVRRRARLVVFGILLSSRDVLPAFGITLPGPLAAVMAKVRYGDHWALDDDVLGLIPDAVVDTFTVAGTPPECLAKLRALAAAGVSHFALRLWPVDDASPLTPMRVFADQVLERLVGSGADA
jgi:5,10-methylenetetrahydromethanopterin reductase